MSRFRRCRACWRRSRLAIAALSLSFEVTRNALPTIAQSVNRRLSKVVRDTATAVLVEAQHEIQNGDKTGRVYHIASHGEREVEFKNGKTVIFGQRHDGDGQAIEPQYTVTHQASAPGEAPATDAGNLVNTGRVEMVDGSLEANVIFGSEYALAMEFGTVAVGGHIEARPFLGPALEKNAESFRAECAAALAAGIAEGSN